MAQEIMVAGAIYEDVPSVRLPDSQGNFHPFTDTSDTTAVADDVAEGKIFHLADGTAAIGTASGGGGGGDVNPIAPENDVIFVDYDGTIRYSYTAEEFLALTEMPPNPTHEGLVAQGWNWTLEDAQTYVADYGIQTIGQMYITESGDTEIDIELHEGALSPWFGFAVNGTATIDWGDGSANDTVTGTSLIAQIRTRHDYATEGCYTIKTHVVSGKIDLFETTSYSILSTADKQGVQYNYVYSSLVRRVRIGQSTGIGNYAFYGCRGMQTITIPSGMVGIGSRIFYSCNALRAVVIPDGVKTISYNMGQLCNSLSAVSLPRSVISIGSNSFDYCYALDSLAIPNRVTSIEDYMFEQCYSLHKVVIPSGVTVIRHDAFVYCESLLIIIIPSSVTSIERSAFGSCYSLSEIHFKKNTPPTVANSNAFSNLPTNCIIYVPAGSLEAYKKASNYPSPSTYTYVEE